MKKKSIILFIPLLLGLLVVSGCGSDINGSVIKEFGEQITVYKSPTCGCCAGYIAELKKQGFKVETVNLNDLNPTKEKYNIPGSMQSCHTTVIGDYFIEGHVPMEAISKLLEEKPQIDGIALPGMPSGTPGMPGQKKEDFKVYAITDGEYSEFLVV